MSNNTKIEKVATSDLTVSFEIAGNEIKLSPNIVQKYIVGETAGKITLQEFKFFVELCKVRKLNPFLKEAYLIKYNDSAPATMIVGKDAILKRAIVNKDFNGIESGVIVINEAEEIVERKGTFHLETEKVVGGWAKVYRKDWEFPTYASVGFEEVAGRKSNGELNSNWKTKGATMVEKVAKVRALRETFIEDLGGMYEAEEMQVDDIPKVEMPIEDAKIIEEEETPIETKSLDEI